MQELHPYRRFAEFCEQLAERDELKQDRAWLVAMAERWRDFGANNRMHRLDRCALRSLTAQAQRQVNALRSTADEA
jgi:hypothetical protein